MNGRPVESPWLVVHPAPRPAEPRLRLFCFHYAGATASAFRSWPEALPEDVQLVAAQLPGREYRLAEALMEDAAPIVAALADAIPSWLDRPYAFLGHSMGALIAFDLARVIRLRGGRPPDLFVASGRNAPRFRWRDAGVQCLPDEAFIDTVRDYNGTPEALLTEPSMRDLWLPRLRADLTVSATYRYEKQPPLACPILVLHGSDDRLIDEAGLHAWRHETTGPVRQVRYPGNHFFLQGQAPRVLADLGQALRQLPAFASPVRPPIAIQS